MNNIGFLMKGKTCESKICFVIKPLQNPPLCNSILSDMHGKFTKLYFGREVFVTGILERHVSNFRWSADILRLFNPLVTITFFWPIRLELGGWGGGGGYLLTFQPIYFIVVTIYQMVLPHNISRGQYFPARFTSLYWLYQGYYSQQAS
jgi:hypothetical protein